MVYSEIDSGYAPKCLLRVRCGAVKGANFVCVCVLVCIHTNLSPSDVIVPARLDYEYNYS